MLVESYRQSTTFEQWVALRKEPWQKTLRQARSLLLSTIVSSLITAVGSTTAASDAFARGEATERSKLAQTMVITAFGQTGDPSKVSRTVRIVVDNSTRYNLKPITISENETVRFVVLNRGTVLHDLMLGTEGALTERIEAMKRHHGIEHEEAYMTHASPKKTAEIIWQFSQPGEFQYACVIPGHSQPSRVGVIRVVPK